MRRYSLEVEVEVNLLRSSRTCCPHTSISLALYLRDQTLFQLSPVAQENCKAGAIEKSAKARLTSTDAVSMKIRMSCCFHPIISASSSSALSDKVAPQTISSKLSQPAEIFSDKNIPDCQG